MSTTLLDSSPLSTTEIKYTIESCSSFTPGYPPENIYTDHPDDVKSRWSTERHSDPGIQESQWVILKLEKLSVVTMIRFGKFMKTHPCNVSAFRVYGGPGTKESEMHELIRGKLRDDDIPQTFTLNYKTPGAGVPFACRYIKICPISPHGSSYNMSIWHVGLSGVVDDEFTKRLHEGYMKHKDTLALLLVLKHLRRSNFQTAHASLLSQTGLRTEHPKITQLHDALVLNADLATTEELVRSIAGEEGLFEHCARVSPPACVWKKITPEGDAGKVPVGRGGHQLCLDVERGVIYLFGGWDGAKNLSDFWSYTIATNQWKVIHEDTAAVGGPSARSCHNMVYCHTNRTIYVLGQLKELPRPSGGNPQPADADFFKCSLDATGEGGTWTLLNPGGTETAGGPHSISDHQILMYVFGGRAEHNPDPTGTPAYSGMYSFNLVTETWTHIFHDPARHDGPTANPINIYSRTGHGMVLYPPTNEMFIVGGRRSNPRWVSDMYSFTHTTLATQRIPLDPSIIHSVMASRVCIDEKQGEIYMQNERDRSRIDPATFMTYHIDKKLWVRSEPWLGSFKPSANGDVWEGLELPRPRSAHQVVYDSANKVFYMFGGNSGEDGIPRLNDLWSMKLVRPTVQELLRKALLAVRKFRFKLMCDTIPAFEALTYLQTQVSEVVDNDDEDEAAELRGLLSYLLSRTSDEDTRMNGADDAAVNEESRKERRELFDFLMRFVDPAEKEPETELRDIVENV
ncbi:Muskelin N-terminus-domain-containing protein [Rhizoctonia solani]|nr:Muskelin N-terminus-domain-containing protein [Rhizoctonia solani]